jgi:hypothetical protein
MELKVELGIIVYGSRFSLWNISIRLRCHLRALTAFALVRPAFARLRLHQHVAHHRHLAALQAFWASPEDSNFPKAVRSYSIPRYRSQRVVGQGLPRSECMAGATNASSESCITRLQEGDGDVGFLALASLHDEALACQTCDQGADAAHARAG